LCPVGTAEETALAGPYRKLNVDGDKQLTEATIKTPETAKELRCLELESPSRLNTSLMYIG
jgi:hypothetical protein